MCKQCSHVNFIRKPSSRPHACPCRLSNGIKFPCPLEVAALAAMLASAIIVILGQRRQQRAIRSGPHACPDRISGVIPFVKLYPFLQAFSRQKAGGVSSKADTSTQLLS